MGRSDVPAGSSYQDIQRNWTRSNRVYQNLDTSVVVHATYRSPQFLAAWEAEFQSMDNPTQAEMDEIQTRHRLERERESCFFVAVMTGERDWNNLALRNSAWRVYLVTSDGNRVRSQGIRAVKEQDPLYTHFYPFYDTFFEGYEICFPRYPMRVEGDIGLPQELIHKDLDWFELQLRSPMAEVPLRWIVK